MRALRPNVPGVTPRVTAFVRDLQALALSFLTRRAAPVSCPRVTNLARCSRRAGRKGGFHAAPRQSRAPASRSSTLKQHPTPHLHTEGKRSAREPFTRLRPTRISSLRRAQTTSLPRFPWGQVAKLCAHAPSEWPPDPSKTPGARPPNTASARRFWRPCSQNSRVFPAFRFTLHPPTQFSPCTPCRSVALSLCRSLPRRTHHFPP
jgi:hypothetical protein